MKLSVFLQLATLSGAFILPQQDLLADVPLEAERAVDRLPTQDVVSDEFEDAVDRVTSSAGTAFDKFSAKVQDTFDSAWASASKIGAEWEDRAGSVYEDAEDWLEDFRDRYEESSSLGLDVEVEEPEDRRPPHHGPRPPHHGHRKPHLTVYQMIAKSKYTTKLAKLIDDFPDLVEALNGTKANYTIFAPTDRAFEKIPDHAKKPSKKLLEKVLLYHVSDDFYPAGRILASRTIPTLLKSDALGKKPQRLATEIQFRGLTVNFYSRVVAPDIFGTNGVIHGVDNIIVPPPTVLEVLDFLPSSFSTLELGLVKTGLVEKLEAAKDSGKTFFAPSNWAFTKLGPRINGFLFSRFGQKYLEALLKYHVVPNHALYSDALYKGKSSKELFEDTERPPHHGPPRGFFHVELPTLLKDRSLGVDVARYGRLIDIKINAFTRVAVSDLIARDGVIHELNNVLIPPKKLSNGEYEEWDGESEMTEEELMDRLDGWVADEL